LGSTGVSNTKQLLKFIAFIELLSIKNNRWLLEYLEGLYEKKDRNFHNMPLDVEEYLQDTMETRRARVNVYIGVSFESYKNRRSCFTLNATYFVYLPTIQRTFFVTKSYLKKNE
jgi:hypothetical protein